VRYKFESLAGEDQYDLGENWTRQDIIDEAFMLYQAYMIFRNSSCEIITQEPNSAQPYY
jgi:hypothetical protein